MGKSALVKPTIRAWLSGEARRIEECDMARLAKLYDQRSARTRIEETFWELLKQKPLEQITVSELVRQVGCNRATFYYHFEDLNDLAERAIEEALPAEIPLLARTYFLKMSEPLVLSDESRHSIDRLCLLIGKNSSTRLATKIKDALKEMWLEMFGVSGDTLDEATCYVLEFMAGGVVSILGRRGSARNPEPLERCLQPLFSVFAKPAMGFLQGYATEIDRELLDR
jgi:AcrR family transcriptional regulator